MGRGKIKIKFLENKQKLSVTFSNRKAGLIKKAKELSVLCGAEIALIIFSYNDKVFKYSSLDNMDQTLSRFGYTSLLTEPRQRQQHFVSSSQENGAELRNVESMKRQIQKLKIDNARLKGEKLDRMSFSDLISLEDQLISSLRNVMKQKTQIMLELSKSSGNSAKRKRPKME